MRGIKSQFYAHNFRLIESNRTEDGKEFVDQKVDITPNLTCAKLNIRSCVFKELVQ